VCRVTVLLIRMSTSIYLSRSSNIAWWTIRGKKQIIAPSAISLIHRFKRSSSVTNHVRSSWVVDWFYELALSFS